MAMFHLTASTGSRKGGQSAKAKHDYITRSGKYAESETRPGQRHDPATYVAHGNMPVWAWQEGPVEYWSAADAFERANGRLFKQLEFALPVELTEEQCIKLIEKFARQLTETEGLPYTLALHAGGEDRSNPHCHLMISERMNDGIERQPSTWFKRANKKDPAKGGAWKSESLKPQAWLDQVRADWADLANAALAEAGHDARIDHRSLVDQGIDRLATIHEGRGGRGLKRRGQQSDRAAYNDTVREANAAKADAEQAKAEVEAAELMLDQEDYEAQQEAALDRDVPPDEYIEAIPAPKPARRRKRKPKSESAPTPALSPDRDQEPRAVRSAWLDGLQKIDLSGPFEQPATIERYGVQLADHGDAIRVASDPSGTPAQIAAALYSESKAKGWDAIRFSNLSDEAADRVIEMAREDGMLDRISFDDDRQQKWLGKAQKQEAEFSQLVTDIPGDMGDMDDLMEPPKKGYDLGM